jgi:hypothetical protein
VTNAEQSQHHAERENMFMSKVLLKRTAQETTQ